MALSFLTAVSAPHRPYSPVSSAVRASGNNVTAAGILTDQIQHAIVDALGIRLGILHDDYQTTEHTNT